MIIFLYGDDTFRIAQKLTSIKDRFKHEIDPSGMNVSTFEGATVDPGILSAILRAFPFMARKRLVIIKNLFASRKNELLEIIGKEIEKPLPETMLVITEERSAKELSRDVGATKKALFAKLQKEKFAEEIPMLKGMYLSKIIKTLAKEKQLTLDEPTVALLIEEFGGDLWYITNELEKLSALGSEFSLTDDNMEHLAGATPELSIFTLLDTIGARDRKQTITLLEKHFDEGVAPQQIINRIASQIRLLLMIALRPGGRTAATATLAKEFKLHPFQIEKALRAIRAWKLQQLVRFHRALLALDAGTKTSAGDPRALMTKTIARLLT